MFITYLKIAWRNILRHKVYTAVNILGLSLGLCACMVIYLIVSYEFSFDNFHTDKERIYRVMGDVTERTGDKYHFAKVPPPVTLFGRSELSGLDVIAGIIPYNARITIHDSYGSARHFESTSKQTSYPTSVITEPEYFQIFKYHWLAGNANTALAVPFTVVLTENKAQQYFGQMPPDKFIGKQVIYEDSLKVTVTGIVRDWNKNTDLRFTDFISFRTLQNSFLKNKIMIDSWGQGDMAAWVFAKLSKGVSPEQVTSQMPDLVEKHGDPKTKLALWIEPLSGIHFNADIIENPIRTAHKPTLYGLGGIAFFILILAIINFINLSTAQSMQRGKEVGVRKVLGGSRMSIIFQFLTETLFITFFSALLAAIFVKPVLAGFSSFIPNGVSFNFLEPSMLIFLVLLILITAVLAGFYPAKLLSFNLPVLNLKGPAEQRDGENWLLRKGLIVFQFTVSLVFIIVSLIIGNQLRYTREKDPGFTADAIITVETPRGDSSAKIAVLTEKVKQLSGVNKVALQWLSPMTDNPRGMKLKFKDTDQKDFWVTQVAGNEDFMSVYQLKLLAGRNLVKSDDVIEFVINESLSRMMGHKKPEESLGRILYWNDKPYPVVGVVADFHTSSLHNPITPLCIINRPNRQGSLAIKLSSKEKQSGAITTTILHIEKIWKQIYPDATFNYTFYNESLVRLYQKDQQTATLINISTGITIFISCIGLFGLALFAAKKRAKEISIRKILGATITNIAALLTKDFLVPVISALFIASPIAWYFGNVWLQGFTYRIDISAWVFILAGLMAILIALLTVGYQTIKASIINPVKNLRRE